MEEYHLGECGENQDRKLYMQIFSWVGQVIGLQTDEMGDEGSCEHSNTSHREPHHHGLDDNMARY